MYEKSNDPYKWIRNGIKEKINKDELMVCVNLRKQMGYGNH